MTGFHLTQSSCVTGFLGDLCTILRVQRLRSYALVDAGKAHAKAVVPCQNKIILKNFRPEPPPSVDRPKVILFQHGTTYKMK